MRKQALRVEFEGEMQITVNCYICRTSMVRKALLRLLPCLHLIHTECVAPIIDGANARWPICREDIVEGRFRTENLRKIIIECSNKVEDWSALGMKYKTVCLWIRSGEIVISKRGGVALSLELLNVEKLLQ